MKSLTEIYNQLREQVLPNTQTKGNANQSSARGGTMSVATGAVPSVPKTGQAALIRNNPRAGMAATSRTSAVKPQGQPVAPAPKPVGVVKKLSDMRNPEMGGNRAREGSAERGHATGSKFSQGAKANAQDANTKRELARKDAGVRKPISGTNGVQAQAKKIVDQQKKDNDYASGTTGGKPNGATGTKPARPDSPMAGQGTSGKATPPVKKGTAQAATPPAKPAEKEQSFGQAFAAARKKAGGGGGVFTYKGKKYQTNVKGEKYLKGSKLKSVDESIDHKDLYKTIRFIIEGENHTDHKTLGATHKPKQSIFKNTLGALEKRKWSGNQDRNANSSYTVSNTLVAEKNTDTGEAEDEITVNPKEKSKANNNSNSVTQKL